MEEKCFTCMHAIIEGGRYICHLPGIQVAPHPVPAMYTCQHWDTLEDIGEDYVQEDQQTGRDR